MAMGGDVKAGAAYVTLYARSNPLMKGLSAASARLKSFGKTAMTAGTYLTGLSVAAGYGMFKAIKTFSDAGSALVDMSARTRLSVATLAQLGYAADQTGASIKDVESAIKFAKKKGYGTDFVKLAEGIAAIEDPAARAKRAIEIFGKSGGHILLPMIENLKTLMDRAKELNVGPTEKEAALADELGDKWSDMKASVMGLVFAVGGALAPTLIELLESTMQIVASISSWVRENGELVVLAGKLLVAFMLLGPIIFSVGAVIFGVGAVLGGLVTIVGAVAVAFKVAFIAIGAVIALVLSPLGLFVAALLFIPGLFASLSSFAVAAFTEIKDVAMSTFGGIADALMSGNIMLAGQILWTALKILWAEGTTWLLNKWTDFKTGVAAIFLGLVNWMKSIWLGFGEFFSHTLYENIASAIADVRGLLGARLFRKIDAALGGALSGAESGANKAVAGGNEASEQRRRELADELAGQMAELNAAAEEEKAGRAKQIDILKKQLDALNKQAAAAKDAKKTEEYVPGGPQEEGLPAGAGKTPSFVTFSAGGLLAQSGGGGVKAIVDELRKVQEALLRLGATEAETKAALKQLLVGAA